MLKFIRIFLSTLIIIAVLTLSTQVSVDNSGSWFAVILCTILLLFILWLINNPLVKNITSLHSSRNKDNNYNQTELEQIDTSKIREKAINFVKSFFITCIICAIPTLLFYWILNKKSDKTIVFTMIVVCSFCSIIYFFLNREKFNDPSKIIGYFSGTIVGPITLTQALLYCFS